MKFNYGKIFLLGFGFFGVSVIWSVYNAFVPVFLQDRFGLSAGVIGFFMTLVNIAALFIQPPLGAWSDRLRTPMGRRLPFVLIGAPLAAVAFGFIPLAGVLPLFVACTSTLLLSMALWRTPIVALMPDITPSKYRSQANGIINFMGGLGAIIAFLLGSSLYDKNVAYPFWLGSVLVIVAALLVLFFIREPKEFAASDLPEKPFEGFGQYLVGKIWWFVGVLAIGLVLLALAFFNIFALPFRITLVLTLAGLLLLFVLFYALFMAREPIHDKDRSGIRLLLAIFSWFVGYNAIEAFFTLYAVNHLGLPASDGSRLLGHLSLLFVLFALVSGFIGGKIGRRWTISIGVSLLGLLILVMYFLPPATLVIPLTKLPVLGVIPVISLFLMGAGIAWALININSLPMVVDLVPDARIGTYTGLYYLFSTLAAIAGPNINGWVIQWTGNDYNTLMLLAPAFMLAALLLMLGVRRGEAKPS